MRTTFTIFRLSLRSILRERVAVSMLGLLLLVLTLLPAGLQSDGTIEGAVRMQIRYSLGFSFILLAGMTLWASCASMAGDLSSKRLHMVLTKPVSRAAVWWGKWMAVVTLVTALGLLCGAVTLFRVHRVVKDADLTEEQQQTVFSQVLAAREAVDAPEEDFTEEAVNLYERREAAGGLPENTQRDQILPLMERYLRVERNAVDPGSSASWRFTLSEPLNGGDELQLFYRFDGSAMGVNQLDGEWIVTDSDGLTTLRFPVTHIPSGHHVISFTVPAGMHGINVLKATFENPGEDSSKVFFALDRGVRIFLPGGSFSLNLFKSVLLLAGLLAILAAIGTTTGSIFSLPVACYSASVVLLVQAFSGVVSEVVTRGLPADFEKSSWIVQRLTELQLVVFRCLLYLLRPMQMENPLGRVAEGIQIPSAEVLSILCLRFAPVVLLAAVVGILLFSRREAGAAS